MKKKVFLFAVLVLSLILISPFIMSANNTQVDKGYTCLEQQIDSKTCSSLSVNEKIFSVLATGKCRSSLISDAGLDNCWPDENCDIKTTAQAILALGKSSTEDARAWLLTQNQTVEDITWYLQIEADADVSQCTISYDGDSYTIDINEDKTLDSDAGNCLSLTSSGYWLEISPTCYNQEFTISCEDDFLTNLLFKQDNSDTIHVSEKTSSASASGTTHEKVDSSCFESGGECDYEASLWAAMVLDTMGEEISSYIPYLVTNSEENSQYLPESFLYSLTGYEDIYSSLISKQLTEGNWKTSGNAYYDTALAVLPLDDSTPRIDAEQWLLSEQDSDGCWNSKSISDTAFILYSVWPKYSEDEIVCEEAGDYCISNNECEIANGEVLDYSCSGFDICCSKNKVLESCENLDGTICSSGETCDGAVVDSTEGACCLSDCIASSTPSDISCESNSGVCEPGLCGKGYERSYDFDCSSYGDICCIKTNKGPNAFFWILLILIILAVLAIIFRNRLREFWFRIKPKKHRPRRMPPGPGLPPLPFPENRRRVRHIMPAMHREPPRPVRRKPSKDYGELEEVIKRLKHIGNK